MLGAAKRPRRRPLLPEWRKMQGLVLSAYPTLEQAAYLLYSVADAPAATRWLGTVVPRVANALKNQENRSPRTNRPCNINLAFTWTGLTALGGSPSHFSDPFTEGIADEGHRSYVLGDTGENSPAGWRWGGPTSRVDVLLMVFAHRDVRLDDELGAVTPPQGAMRLVESVIAQRPDERNFREHFGFRDGISQPILMGSTDAERFPESIHLTALGEFALGYPNAAGVAFGGYDATGQKVPLPQAFGDLCFGRNGTYLVLRQLAQDVDLFDCTMRQLTSIDGRADPDRARQLAAKIVGRWPDGTPLVPFANANDNEFRYANDPYGYACPIGSHIRRANPRDAFENNNLPFEPQNNQRILRRGRSYEQQVKGKLEKGLLFLCLNADVERQFEFIQQNWVNSPAFAGLADERDPLIGARGRPPLEAADEPAAKYKDNPASFTIQSLPAPICLHGLPRFVTVVGGQYFFLPSIPALKSMVAHA